MDSKRIILFFVFSLAVFDIFLWAAVFNGGGGDKLQIYFLNVGQGDSELLVLPGIKPARILIDSGPNGAAAKELEGRKQAYKIIGSIMVAGEARTFAEELQERKEAFELRIKAIEKQESQIKEKTQKLQKDVMEALKEK